MRREKNVLFLYLSFLNHHQISTFTYRAVAKAEGKLEYLPKNKLQSFSNPAIVRNPGAVQRNSAFLFLYNMDALNAL